MARCSSAGVSGKHRDKGKLDGTEISMPLGTPAEMVQGQILMEQGWPGYNGLLQMKR